MWWLYNYFFFMIMVNIPVVITFGSVLQLLGISCVFIVPICVVMCIVVYLYRKSLKYTVVQTTYIHPSTEPYVYIVKRFGVAVAEFGIRSSAIVYRQRLINSERWTTRLSKLLHMKRK